MRHPASCALHPKYSLFYLRLKDLVQKDTQEFRILEHYGVHSTEP